MNMQQAKLWLVENLKFEVLQNLNLFKYWHKHHKGKIHTWPLVTSHSHKAGTQKYFINMTFRLRI
jgi:hypothetical protein